ncbi:uncharacterized protein LOC128393786 [Panonychus citri]|uniref:uncharacterized protein LOC128393786 n=1 Tax=Panonychus citri TaxID=50023 RepID=UPI0023075E5C|nr:uncharacterized protein LOC128393786 [Panonychus citri]
MSSATKLSKQYKTVHKNLLTENGADRKAIVAAIQLFKECVSSFAGGDEDDGKRGEEPIDFDLMRNVIDMCFVDLLPAIHKFLKLPSPTAKTEETPDSRPLDPSKSKKWEKLVWCLKVYLNTILKLMDTTAQETLLTKLLRHNLYLIPFFLQFNNLSKNLLKRVMLIWSQGDEKNRVLAFLIILRIIRRNESTMINFIMKKLYLAYVKNCKLISKGTWPLITFMQQSLVELYSLDQGVAYQHAFVFIRQCAITLRNAAASSDKEPFKAVYNWQYVQSLLLWARLLTCLHPSDVLKPLIHPFVQVCIGTIKHLSVARYFPLRLHLVKALIKLSITTNTFIPILPLITEVLDVINYEKKFKSTKQKKRLDIDCLTKVSQNFTDEKLYVDACVTKSFELILEYLSCQSHSIAFPELSFFTLRKIRKFSKKSTLAHHGKMMKKLGDKIEETVKLIEEKRKHVNFALKDENAINQWQNELRDKGTPLTKYFTEWQKEMAKKKEEEIEEEEDEDEDEDEGDAIMKWEDDDEENDEDNEDDYVDNEEDEDDDEEVEEDEESEPDEETPPPKKKKKKNCLQFIMPPILAFKLPILLSKPLDNQLLTLYLIRSNPHKKPYDPNYLEKKKRKRSKTKSNKPPQESVQPSKSLQNESPKCKPIPAATKESTSKPVKSKESKSNSKSKTKPSTKSKPLSQSKTVSKSKESSTSKTANKSSPSVANLISSQVLSIPSTSKEISTQFKNVPTTKTTPKKRSSQSSSNTGTPSTSRSDSTAPRTPLKSNLKSLLSSYPSPSPPKPKQLKKEPKVSTVSSVFGGFKIPKKSKVIPKSDEKMTIPKRLQPSGFSPLDSIIGPSISGEDKSRPSVSSTPGKFDLSQSLVNQNTDLDPLESDEPELGFDLYGAEEPISQPLEEDFSSENIDPLIREEDEGEQQEQQGEEGEEEEEVEVGEEAKEEIAEEEEEEEEAENFDNWRLDDPMDESCPTSLPEESILKQLDDESESSEDEGNFKRRGVKNKVDIKTETISKRKGRDEVVPPRNDFKCSQSTPLKPKVIPLRSSSSRPQIPASLSPPRNLPSTSQPQHKHNHTTPPPPPPTPSSTPSSSLRPTVQSIITKISSIESSDDAMKNFLEAYKRFPKLFAVAVPRFQTLFRTLLLNLFRDLNFMFNQEKFTILLNQMRQLGMDESYNWEEIICSWGKNYETLLSNQAKLENMIKVITHIYNHLQSNKILINLPAAGLLYEMKMVKNE